MKFPRELTLTLTLSTTGLAVIAILLTLNVLASRWHIRWDVTPNRIYVPSPQTQAVLRKLEAPLRIVLFAEEAELPAHRDRLKEYGLASRHVTVEYVDVEAQPTVARQYDVQRAGTAALEYKGRIELVEADSEQDLTNAVARLIEGRTRKAYFTSGHAERDITSTERVGYSSVAAALQHENFSLQKINLAQQGEVPDDATIVVVAGPRADLFRAEIDALQRYLAKGGAALFLVDPFEDLKRYITESGLALFMMDPSSASATGELKNLTAFIRDWGVELGNDVVVDISEMGQFLGTDASVPVAVTYPAHPITEGLSSLSAYPMARSVRPVSNAGAKTIQSIIETGDQTWAEADIQQLAAGRLAMNADRGDRAGPISLGAAISAPLAGSQTREIRVAVLGDSDFVANYSANVPGNRQLFLAIVHWLTQEDVLQIPPRLPQERTLTMSGSAQRNVFWLSILLLPAVLIGTGVYMWGKG